MLNGDSISNLGSLHNLFCESGGSAINQSALILPRPDSQNEYYVIHNDLKFNSTPGRTYYSIVDISKQDGKGEVVQKNIVFYSGDISRSGMEVTQHSNGRDWWIIFPLLESNGYLKILVNSVGVEVVDTQSIGHVWSDAEVQVQQTFSPDGLTYARFGFSNGLNIFEFDNQTGLFSNPIQIEFDFIEEEFFTGVAISPNSRFLYANAVQTIHQFDLRSEDIANSRVLIGELETKDSVFFESKFYRSFLGPNGKIYIGGTLSFNHLHVIHNPDCKGLNSSLEQYAIKLDEFPRSSLIGVPHIPHFRNQAQDIDCDTVTIVNTNHSILDKDISVYPNPTTDKVFIENTSDKDFIEHIELVSLQGQLLSSYAHTIGDKTLEISIQEFQSGMYYLLFYDDTNRLVSRKKFIKID